MRQAARQFKPQSSAHRHRAAGRPRSQSAAAPAWVGNASPRRHASTCGPSGTDSGRLPRARPGAGAQARAGLCRLGWGRWAWAYSSHPRAGAFCPNRHRPLARAAGLRCPQTIRWLGPQGGKLPVSPEAESLRHKARWFRPDAPGRRLVRYSASGGASSPTHSVPPRAGGTPLPPPQRAQSAAAPSNPRHLVVLLPSRAACQRGRSHG